MLKSKELGIVIYTSQVLSSLMPILFIKCKGAKKEYSPQNNKATEIIFDSIDSSTSKMLKLCALICFFATLLATIENTFLVYLSPILEISCGSSFCANLYNTNPFLSILLCGFCCGFSGICVHFQVIMTAKTININYKEFFIIKFFQGVFSGILSVVLYYFFFYAWIVENNMITYIYLEQGESAWRIKFVNNMILPKNVLFANFHPKHLMKKKCFAKRKALYTQITPAALSDMTLWKEFPKGYRHCQNKRRKGKSFSSFYFVFNELQSFSSLAT